MRAQENAHFSISEALIAAIEQMKWNHVIGPVNTQVEEQEESDEEIKQLQQRIRIRKHQKLKEVTLQLCSLLFLLFYTARNEVDIIHLACWSVSKSLLHSL